MDDPNPSTSLQRLTIQTIEEELFEAAQELAQHPDDDAVKVRLDSLQDLRLQAISRLPPD